MTKLKFLMTLHDRLAGLPQNEVEERLAFYCEMIEDRMEEGLSEEEAVSSLGDIEAIAGEIAADIPLAKIAREKIKPKRKLKAWEIVLLALGSPIWFSLLVAAFAIAVSLYAVVWSLVIALWAVFGAVIGCGIYGLIGGAAFAFAGSPVMGVALVSAGLVCAGLGIFLFLGCKGATEGMIQLTKSAVIRTKRSFVRKEAVQ